jgi:hypothetical protein
MEIILIPLKPFAGHPLAVFVLALVFAIPCFLKRYSMRSRWTMGFVSIVWLGYCIWEAYISAWRSPTGDMAIRVDLVFLGPLLLLAAFVGLSVIAFGYQRVA